MKWLCHFFDDSKKNMIKEENNFKPKYKKYRTYDKELSGN